MLLNMLFNLVLCLNFMCGSAFFLWKLKKESLFFCYKVCPLYCSKNRRSDLDYSASSYIQAEWPTPPGPAYWEPDDQPPSTHDHIFPHHDHPRGHLFPHHPHEPHDHLFPHHPHEPHDHLFPHHPHEPHEYEIIKNVKFIYHPYPKTTTTTTTQKPTTPEPSGICMACMKKCYDWRLEHPW